MHIGIVAGEASGDILGAGLIQAIKAHYPKCQFSGIGGEKMLQQGFTSLYPQERLAIMGFVEPLKRLPELLRIRKGLFNHFVQNKVDVVIGIDSPDFNLILEKKCRQADIKTVHYVSPSVWAWRQGRIKLIKQAANEILVLFPFEVSFYKKHHMPVTFVGHPLADRFPLENNTSDARSRLQKKLPRLADINDKVIIACLPGSRSGEVKYIGPLLWQAMNQLTSSREAIILVPALNRERKQQLQQQLQSYSHLPITVIDGNSQNIMAAADVVVIASGTTTLEAMLLKKPMVVVYKKDIISYTVISRLLKVDYISLPNLLANEALVPELLQQAATPDAISQALNDWLNHPQKMNHITSRFHELHRQLQGNASVTAANVVMKLAKEKTNAS